MPNRQKSTRKIDRKNGSAGLGTPPQADAWEARLLQKTVHAEEIVAAIAALQANKNATGPDGATALL